MGERRGLIAVVSGAVTGRFNVGTTAVAIGNVLKIVTLSKIEIEKKKAKKILFHIQEHEEICCYYIGDQ